MDITTLERANELNAKINDISKALDSLRFANNANPKIIIEFTGDGQEQQVLPISLSDELVNLLTVELAKARIDAVNDFNDL